MWNLIPYLDITIDMDYLQPFIQREELSGIRSTWSCLVADPVERQKISVPIGILCTPFKTLKPEQIIVDMPVICKCGAALNMRNTIYANERSYACRFCNEIQPLPPRMENISQDNIPPELSFMTVEYQVPKKSPHPPSVILLLDTCISQDEFNALKNLVHQNMLLLPAEFRVGLITVGQVNNIYDLSYTDVLRSYSFQSSREYTPAEYASMLGIDANSHTAPIQQFLLPAQEALIALEAILKEITVDPFQPKEFQRKQNGTGSALSLALTVQEILNPQSPGRIMLFLGTPCSVGPGQVIGLELKEKMRQHHNIVNEENLTYFDKAKKYYNTQAARAVTIGCCIDIFMGCQDQVGFAEMADLVDLTGGYAVLCDSFSSTQFQFSFQKLFDRGECTADDLDMAFNAKISVKATEYLKIIGELGPCQSLGVKSPNVHSLEIGKGGTYEWKLNAYDSSTTLAFVFDIATPESDSSIISALSALTGKDKKDEKASDAFLKSPVVQIQTLYTRANGSLALRVSTIDFRWVNPDNNSRDLIASFDAEAATCVMARYALYKCLYDVPNDVVRWIDRMLIRLVQRFGQYTPGEPESFVLPPSFTMFPQSIFYLRRNRVLRVFNHTPDETAFFRLILNRETVNNMMTIIQPTMFAFELNKDPAPVLLDVSSITKDRILVLDTFFRLIVHHGENIAVWREQKLQEKPEYAHLKKLLAEPLSEAQQLLQERFPTPQVTVCDQNSSQARFLVSQLNPSITQQSQKETPSRAAAAPKDMQAFSFEIGSREQAASNSMAANLPMMFSDDVTLKVFLEHLKAIVTKKQ